MGLVQPELQIIILFNYHIEYGLGPAIQVSCWLGLSHVIQIGLGLGHSTARPPELHLYQQCLMCPTAGAIAYDSSSASSQLAAVMIRLMKVMHGPSIEGEILTSPLVRLLAKAYMIKTV